MHQPNSVKVVKIKKLVARPGFSDRFHCVTFELAAEGLTPLSCQVWVDPAYPEGALERVPLSHSFIGKITIGIFRRCSRRSS